MRVVEICDNSGVNLISLFKLSGDISSSNYRNVSGIFIFCYSLGLGGRDIGRNHELLHYLLVLGRSNYVNNL